MEEIDSRLFGIGVLEGQLVELKFQICDEQERVVRLREELVALEEVEG